MSIAPDQIAVDQNVPLVVDLDGTLLRTDLLMESFLELIKRNFLYLFVVPFWLLKGRAWLKHQIAARVDLDVKTLPYSDTFIEFLKEQKNAGRPLVLCTASDQTLAKQVAEHLGLFNKVLASSPELNLKGIKKAEVLGSLYGPGRFDYAANAVEDMAVWEKARQRIAVNTDPRVLKQLQQKFGADRVFAGTRAGLPTLLRVIRVYQWVKNLLIFLPLLAAQLFNDSSAIIASLIAFMAFSLCSSSVYVLNDMMDLRADRHHFRKRFRPFSSGELSLTTGFVLIPVLLLSSLSLALLLPQSFFLFLVCYFFFSTSYSIYLKLIPVLDVLILAGLYTLRILAGAAAISVIVSFWLLSFSMFFFLSIALAKRYNELQEHKAEYTGRKYRQADLITLMSQGASSGHVAVLIFALYINSDEVLLHYHQPELLWFICPLLLYWISKLWLNTQRGEVHDDPLVWAVTNRVSRGIALLCAAILLVSN